MTYIKYYLLTSILILGIGNSVLNANVIEIPEENLLCSHKIASKIKVVYDSDQKEFSAFLDGNQKRINKYDVSGIPSNLTELQIENFLRIGYFSLNQIGEDYSLKANFRLNGGSGKKGGSSLLNNAGKFQTGQWVVDTVLNAGGHRGTEEFLRQGNHRGIKEFWDQGNHRSFGQWISGVPSRNSRNSKK